MYPNKMAVLEEMFDEACLLIQDEEEVSYLTALVLATMIIAGKAKSHFHNSRLNDILELLTLEEDLEMLTTIYIKLMSKGFKEVNYPIDILIPEGVCYLVGYIINGLHFNKYYIQALDLNLKAGNFLYSTSRFLEHKELQLVGFEDNEVLGKLAETLFTLGSKEFFIKPKEEVLLEQERYDLLLGNLDYLNLVKSSPNEVIDHIEKYIDCLKEDHYFVFLIDNTVVFSESFPKFYDKILKNSTLRALVVLPENLFLSSERQKSILIGKKTPNMTENLLVVNLPNIKDDNLDKVIENINELIYELTEEEK